MEHERIAALSWIWDLPEPAFCAELEARLDLSGQRRHAIKACIDDVLRENLSVNLAEIALNDGVDQDGDHVLRVRIVLDGSPSDLDHAQTIGLMRDLRPRLAELQCDRFPVLSFFAKQEAGRLRDAA